MNGYFALILHAHLPYVRHPDHDDFLEEDWLNEAIFETYLPLLKMLRGLAADRAPLRITFTLTPTLCEMLRDPLLQSRAARYLERGLDLARSEIERTSGDSQLNELAHFYERRFADALELYERVLNRDLVGAFAQLQEDGLIEIITCAATHGFLPMMESVPEAMRAQILIGRDSYRECFGRDPEGIWLPECAYLPTVGPLLRDAGIRWFVVDAHGLVFGKPRPRFAIFAPVHTPAGPTAFARDRESSRQVWSAKEGYPGDPAYRDFYRDAGLDLPAEYLSRFMPLDHRRYTGIKYHRVTGRAEKELYNRGWAEGAADAHASHFLESRVTQFRQLRTQLPVDPILVAPFDAELFGHWWFEGPEFLNFFLRKAAFDQSEFSLVTPSDFLRSHPTQQIVEPAPSTWGHNGYLGVWVDHCNAWMYPHLHEAARQMTACAQSQHEAPLPDGERLLRQMARELLLAQSSDWAFLMKTGTATQYATARTKSHISRFHALCSAYQSQTANPPDLAPAEHDNPLFERLNWQHYL